jgi:hypothetical protein
MACLVGATIVIQHQGGNWTGTARGDHHIATSDPQSTKKFMSDSICNFVLMRDNRQQRKVNNTHNIIHRPG